jgi:hypothetical protein
MRAVAGMFGRLAVAVTAVASLAVAGAAPAHSSADRAGPRGPAARTVLAARQPGMTRPTAPQAARKPPAGDRRACGAPTDPARMSCFALIRSAVHGSARPTNVRPSLVTPGAYQPADLQSAYALTAASAGAGNGQTVAVVDAFDDPNAAADLATYRQQWGLPACDTATGAGCLTKVNQKGAASPLPPADFTGGWEVEESLDVDMVTAICPNCHILLVEAATDLSVDLEAAEDQAVALGAKYVSDSWGGSAMPSDEQHFRHPGVAIVAAAGDNGYLTSFPASSQFVTSVGGTSLTRDPQAPRGWAETAWNGTGSGCAAAWAKPAWQRADNTEPTGCLARTDNDVAAVGDPNTGVWVYDSTPFDGQPVDWQAVGGTSASAPIIAGVYALAGQPQARTFPASYLYLPGRAASLNDVTSGSNGHCESVRAYLCNATAGYDGPTGWGTPSGVAAFAPPASRVITVADPGNRDVGTGRSFTVSIQALDSAAGQRLTYSAAGLPKSLSISPATGRISGTLPARGSVFRVTVTATDGTGAHGSASFRVVVAASLRAAYHKVTGPVRLTLDPRTVKCLTDAGNSARDGTKIELWPCDGKAAQQWTYLPDASPDGAGKLIIRGKCLTIGGNGKANGSKAILLACDGSGRQEWSLQDGPVTLANPASGRCLDDPADRPGKGTPNGTQADVFDCLPFLPTQTFTLPPGPVMSAIWGLCVNDPGGKTTTGIPVTIAPCSGSAGQKWDLFSTPQLSPVTHAGQCWVAAAVAERDGTSAFFDGTPVKLGPCFSMSNPFASNVWFPLPDGEIQQGDSGLCLADPGNSKAAGLTLVLNDCYGDPGELWAVS